MWYDIQIIIRMIVNCAFPLALIFNMSNFKCKRKTVWMLYAGLNIFGTAVNLILFFVAGRQVMMQLFAIIIAVPCIILLLLFTRGRLSQLLFNFFTAINVLYLVSVIGRIIAGMDEIIWLDALIKGTLYAGILYLFANYFSRPYRFLVVNMKKGWFVISLIPFLFFCMVMFLGLYPTVRKDNFPAVLMLYAVLCCVYIVIYQVLRNTYDLLSQEQAKELLAAQLAMQRAQNALQEENLNQVKILRHDLRHYTKTVGALLKEGDVGEAIKVLEGYDQLFEKTRVREYCKNVVINTVLSYYIAYAEKMGIEVKTRLEIADEIPVDTDELACVFANAMDNACRACLRLPEGEKKQITITFLSNPHCIFEISNTCDGEILFDENHIPITEEDGHGYGTQSILAFVRKNHALLNYKVENGIFSIQILLQVI